MDAELLPARINDTAELCKKTCTPKFLGFLTSAEAALARNILKNARVRNDFFGGYEGAERVILGCFPDWAEDFPYPISPLPFLSERRMCFPTAIFWAALWRSALSARPWGIF